LIVDAHLVYVGNKVLAI